MSRSKKSIVAALLAFFLVGLKTISAQTSDPEFQVPEFFISLAASVVTVTQGEATTLTISIRCNTSSFVAVKECNDRPSFALDLSEIPEGISAQTAGARIGDNTIAILAASKAKTGSFPINVTVVAGSTTQVQTFVLNVREAPPVASAERGIRAPVTGTAGPLPAWEHHVLVAKTPEQFERMADDLGQDSWELVSVVSRQNAHGKEWIGFFRRPTR
ncbi:MAG TPA: hypothetical protein VGJ30_18820 [Candidatus Angelobacter sp.]|jgi:hypothetical protein